MSIPWVERTPCARFLGQGDVDASPPLFDKAVSLTGSSSQWCPFVFQNKKVVKTVPAYKPVPSREASGNESGSDHDLSDGDPHFSSTNHKDSKPGIADGSKDLKDSSSVTSNSSKKGKKGRKPLANNGPSSSLSLNSNSNLLGSEGGSGNKQSMNAEGQMNRDSGSTSQDSSFNHSLSSSVNTSTSSTDSSMIIGNKSSGNENGSPVTVTRNDASSANEPVSSPSGEKTNTGSSDVGNASVSTASPSQPVKPPSVIVKFGKQDGTYYSKKESSLPEDTTLSTPSVVMSTSSGTSCNANNSINSSAGAFTSSGGPMVSKEKDRAKEKSKKEPMDYSNKAKEQDWENGAKKPAASERNSLHSHHSSQQQKNSSGVSEQKQRSFGSAFGSSGTHSSSSGKDHNHSGSHPQYRDYHGGKNGDDSGKSRSSAQNSSGNAGGSGSGNGCSGNGSGSGSGSGNGSKDLDLQKSIIRTSECSVSLDKSKIDSMRLVSGSSLSQSSSSYQGSSSVKATVYASSPPESGRKIPASNIIVATAGSSATGNGNPSNSGSPSKLETRKDSPAKILPISASTSPSTGSASFGKPLKVEVNHSSGSNSKSTSVEVSPVKFSSGERSREVSPPRVSQDVNMR